MPQKKKQNTSNVKKAPLFEMVAPSDDDSTGESRELVTTDICVKDTYDVEAESPYEGLSFIKKLSLLIIINIKIIFLLILKYTRQGKRKSQCLES
jgi:hypothetical protein